MTVPKKRLTKRRQGNRRSQAHGKLETTQLAKCSNCGNRVSAHAVCYKCGYYRGKKILNKLI
jgi:large subunit ribosomal protein L32